MGKRKVVVDTNVFISALGWDGPERKIYKSFVRGELDVYISQSLIAELKKVLKYPKLSFDEPDKETLLRNILRSAHLVDPKERIHKIKEDPSDNRILECAVEAGADCIVTGDTKHLLPLKEYQGIRILSPTNFLKEP